MGVQIPEGFSLTLNSDGDDPPDIFALNLGWECTEFPPDQSALRKVHEERGPLGMMVPGFAETRGDIGLIRAGVSYAGVQPPFYTVNDQLAALAEVFANKVIGGPKSKDVQGNDVLLLDQRQDYWPEAAEMALRSALKIKQPRFIKLILLVGFKAFEVGDTALVPLVARVYP